MGIPMANGMMGGGGGGSGFQGHFNPAFMGGTQGGTTNRNSTMPDGPRKRIKNEGDA